MIIKKGCDMWDLVVEHELCNQILETNCLGTILALKPIALSIVFKLFS
jgi:hypothetical protein